MDGFADVYSESTGGVVVEPRLVHSLLDCCWFSHHLLFTSHHIPSPSCAVTSSLSPALIPQVLRPHFAYFLQSLSLSSYMHITALLCPLHFFLSVSSIFVACPVFFDFQAFCTCPMGILSHQLRREKPSSPHSVLVACVYCRAGNVLFARCARLDWLGCSRACLSPRPRSMPQVPSEEHERAEALQTQLLKDRRFKLSR